MFQTGSVSVGPLGKRSALNSSVKWNDTRPVLTSSIFKITVQRHMICHASKMHAERVAERSPLLI